VRHYRAILGSLGDLLQAFRSVIAEHGECDCYLCERARGLLWVVEGAHASFATSAPTDVPERLLDG
jgi:hypothetical protein